MTVFQKAALAACVLALAVGLSARGTARPQPSPRPRAVAAPMAQQPRPEPLAVPAAEGSGMYALAASPDGHVYVSWIEPLRPSGHALKFAELTSKGWSAARVIAQGGNWFVNWADHPSIAALANGDLVAHWLVKNTGTKGHYGYGLRIARSTDRGATWREVFTAGADHTTDYSGFVSLLPRRAGFLAAYLAPLKPARSPASSDAAPRAGGTTSRATPPVVARSATAHDAAASAAAGHAAGEPTKTLTVATFGPDGALQSDATLDDDTCSCCVTTAAETADGPIVAYRDHEAGELRDISLVRLIDGRWTAPRTVYRDGWVIHGCPTNGPALAATNRRVALAWFTAANDQPRVKVAFSSDAGETFAPPVVIDDGRPVGWVGVALLDDGAAAVSWFATREDGGGEVRVRRVSRDGQLGASVIVAASPAGRSTGIPQMVRDRNHDSLLVAWRTDRVMSARIPLAGLDLPAIAAAVPPPSSPRP